MRKPFLLKLSTALAVTVALQLPHFAQAQDPPPPQPINVSLGELAAGVACTFPVRVDVAGKTAAITLVGGRQIIIAPEQFTTVTNLSTLNSVKLSATGAFHTTKNPTTGFITFVITGRNVVFDPVAGLAVAIGNFNFTIDAATPPNLITPLNGTGRLQQICPMID